ncbi:MAG: hypothetical protein M1831_000813 [Alyxoria varia]|nr:MAG: hypothetical protein M1831_000813 [Alyxoria varia]
MVASTRSAPVLHNKAPQKPRGLGRSAKGLLRQVNGTDRDTYEASKVRSSPPPQPTQPTSDRPASAEEEEDYDRPPEDSSESDGEVQQENVQPKRDIANRFIETPSEKWQEGIAGVNKALDPVGRKAAKSKPDTQPTRKSTRTKEVSQPSVSSPSKRKREEEDTDPFENGYFGPSSSYGSSQRRVKTYSTRNLHTSSGTVRRDETKEEESSKSTPQSSKGTFKHRKEPENDARKPTAPAFKAPNKVSPGATHSKTNFKMPEIPQSSATFDSRKNGSNDSAPSSLSSTNDLTLLKSQQSNKPHSNASSSSLSSPPSRTPSPPLSPSKAHCPICKDAVDRLFFEENTPADVRHMRWKAKLAFCNAHKRRTAMEKYPSIDWDKFDGRLRRFDKDLDRLLDPNRQSKFRDELAGRVAQGFQSRHVLRNPDQAGREVELPGYYGSRGAARMQSYIMANFSDMIRGLAAKDHLISEMGTAGYVQAVLVPELALLLVQDDFKCDAEEAQAILSQSAEIGDLLNADVEEKVQRRDDDESDEEQERRQKTRVEEDVDDEDEVIELE